MYTLDMVYCRCGVPSIEQTFALTTSRCNVFEITTVAVSGISTADLTIESQMLSDWATGEVSDIEQNIY